MDKDVKVSVIMPVHNTKKYIEKSINSVLSQTFRNYEFIIVDDGSTDGSSEICDSFAACDKRIKVIHKENRGVSMARNTGMDIATGKYIYFMDSDDYIEPKLLEDNVKIAEENNCDMVFFGMRIENVDVSGDKTRKNYNYIIPPYEGVYNYSEFTDVFLNHLKTIPPSACTRIYSRNFIDKVRFNPDIHYSEDALFNLDILENKFERIAYNKKCYYSYVIHVNSAVYTFCPFRYENEAYVIRKKELLLDMMGVTDDFKTQLNIERTLLLIREYENVSLPDCAMSVGEVLLRLRKCSNDAIVKKAVKNSKINDFGCISYKIIFILIRLRLTMIAYFTMKFLVARNKDKRTMN